MQSGLLHLKVDHLWKQTQIRLDAVPVLRLPKASLIQIFFRILLRSEAKIRESDVLHNFIA